jgi:hypothetical protein
MSSAKGQEEEKRISYQAKCTQVSMRKKKKMMLRPRQPRRTSMRLARGEETYNPRWKPYIYCCH